MWGVPRISPHFWGEEKRRMLESIGTLPIYLFIKVGLFFTKINLPLLHSHVCV